MAIVKINVPVSEEEYNNGNGEGVFAEVNDDVQAKYDEDVCDIGGDYEAVLKNSSWNYPWLKIGSVVPIELRGSERPVVKYDWLVEHNKYEIKHKLMLAIWDTLRGLTQFAQFSDLADARHCFVDWDETVLKFTANNGKEYELTLKESEV